VTLPVKEAGGNDLRIEASSLLESTPPEVAAEYVRVDASQHLLGILSSYQ